MAKMNNEMKELQARVDALMLSQKQSEFEAYARSQGLPYADAAAKLVDYDAGKNHADMLKQVITEHPVLTLEPLPQRTIGGPSMDNDEPPMVIRRRPKMSYDSKTESVINTFSNNTKTNY